MRRMKDQDPIPLESEQAAGFRHDAPESLGILLVNLGTPDSPTRADVRRYLKEFLWDPRVVELPRPLWWLLLNGVILNTRPRRSARAYAKIWTEQGSPLMVISRRQRSALQSALAQRLEAPVEVALAMRYGSPGVDAGLEALRAAGARRVLVLPLYPQYSATTTASVFDAVADTLRRWRWLPELRFINHYHDFPPYIEALAASIREYWSLHGEPDRLVMSFHGIPRDYFLAGDPYYCECHKSARLLADALGLPRERWLLTFQSRIGPKQWLEPYTDRTLAALPAQGVKKVQVVCPGFSADCLETLEEVAIENRAVFLEAGGADYAYIPCLNERPEHIDALAGLVASHVRGWMPPLSREVAASELSQRKSRAVNCGASS